jgi:Annexin
MYTKDLGSDLTRELGGDLEQLALNSLQAMEEEYDEGKFDDERMSRDMKALNKMGEGNWRGTDEAGMFKIMIKAPSEYLKKMDMKYAEEYGNTLHKALENELNGIVQEVALYLFGSKTNPTKEVAKLINSACQGIGTNEDLLNVSLVRFASIMSDVKLEYVELYGKTIADSIRQETRGDSEKLLLYIIGEAE